MRQPTTGEVRLDASKAARFDASARSIGWFDRPVALAERDLSLSKTPEAAIRVHNHPESGECRMIGLKSSVKLALEARRIMNSDLPAPMRRGVRNAAIRLRLSEDGRLPNPVPIAGFAVSYFHEEQLRYLFREI